MRTFFDTNILVYLFDADAGEKKAGAVLLVELGGGCLSRNLKKRIHKTGYLCKMGIHRDQLSMSTLETDIGAGV